MLVFDVKDHVEINMSDSSVFLELKGKGINFSLIKSGDLKLKGSGDQLNHRNGVVDVAFVEFAGNKITDQLKTK